MIRPKIIKYYFKNNIYKDYISPAKNFIPEWYKNIKKPIQEYATPYKTNIKNCMPFLDAFTSGYMICLTQDMVVSSKEDIVAVNWNIDNDEAITIGSRAGNFNIPNEFYQTELVWRLPSSIQSPEGYSLLFTHPLNRIDLPFYSLSGIIDSDNAILNGRYPFFIKKDFTGIIPAGTPIIQFIPIKREPWKIEFDESIKELSEKQSILARAKAFGWYKNNAWQRKSYN